MKLHIVVIRDIKANVFAQPQFVANIGGFIRSFADECQEIPKKVPSQNIQRISGLRARMVRRRRRVFRATRNTKTDRSRKQLRDKPKAPKGAFLQPESEMSQNVRDMKQKSVSVHDFAMIPKAEIPRSSFRMEKMVKTAMGFSYLVPIMVEEVLPGDTWKAHITTVARTAVPIVPLMDNWHLEYFAFFVPNRLLWTNWVKFMGEQDNPGDSISYTIPVCNPTTGYAVSSLQDYMGLITTGQNNETPGHTARYHCAHTTRSITHGSAMKTFRTRSQKMSETDQTAPATTCSSNEESEKTTSRAPYRGRRKETQLSLFPSELLHQSMSQPQSLPGIACDSTSWVQRQLDKSSARIQERAQPGEHSAQQVKRWKSLQISLPLPQQRSINSDRVSRYNAYLKRDARGGTRYTEIIRSHFG